MRPRPELGGMSYYAATEGRYNFTRYSQMVGGRIIPGFQLRYIYFLYPTAKERLTVPIIPFSEIGKRGAGMYLGKKRAGTIDADGPAIHAGQGGSSPTPALQISEATP